jgi:orotidine-5'-phosphate decarboxylase
VSFRDRLGAAISARGHLCVGIDPHGELLHAWGLEDSAAGARELGLRVVAATTGRAGVVKPQAAFFERHGAAGAAALTEVLGAARAAGLFVLADAKRGDIGTTMDAYGEGWLTPGADLEADAVTVSPYLGVGALAPAFVRADEAGKGLFVLAATSNPEAAMLQGARLPDGRSVARAVVDDVRDRGHGVVVGATGDLGAVGLTPADLAGMPILAPGYGAQGARLADAPARFGVAAGLVVASASRSILRDGPDGVADAIAAHAAEAHW